MGNQITLANVQSYFAVTAIVITVLTTQTDPFRDLLRYGPNVMTIKRLSRDSSGASANIIIVLYKM